MSQPFLITGLPRSRTAWWSVIASTPISICHHEPLKHTASFDQLAAFWNTPGFKFVGVSDSGIAPPLGRILAEIAPRTLMVVRDREDVEASLEKYFAGCDFDRSASSKYILESLAYLRKWSDHKLVKCVRFEDLADHDVVRDCFDWLMPGSTFAPRQDLMNMNVQVDRGYALAEAAKDHNHWYRA